MANLTREQVNQIRKYLLDLECVFISLKAIAPQLEKDLEVDGGIEGSVGWDIVVSGIATEGRERTQKALETIGDDDAGGDV